MEGSTSTHKVTLTKTAVQLRHLFISLYNIALRSYDTQLSSSIHSLHQAKTIKMSKSEFIGPTDISLDTEWEELTGLVICHLAERSLI